MITKKFIYNILSRVFNISYFKYIKVLIDNESRKAGIVMDLGCGSGQVIESISQMFPQNSCIGVDLMQENSTTNNLTYVKGDIFEFISIANFSECSLIIMNDVIEHFDYDQIIKFMGIVLDKMPKGCCLCLQFPNMSSPFGMRNYFSDHTHRTALTDVKMSGILTRFKGIDFHYLGVEESKHFGLFSFIAVYVYWKLIIRIYGLFLRGSIGWNKYYFYPNLFCMIQKK